MEIDDLKLLSTQAKLHGVTLNALVQGAWALALARYNATEDVTFGTQRAQVGICMAIALRRLACLSRPCHFVSMLRAHRQLGPGSNA